MPPKAKFTRDTIIQAATEIVKDHGEEALTARSLGEALGSSPRPIFTVFESMDEVSRAVRAAATELYDGCVCEGLREKPAFKGVGKAYIRFAAEYPKLFSLLFMHEQESLPSTESILGAIDGNADTILRSIEDEYGLIRGDAKRVYMHLWIYSHGIATLIATKTCKFSEKEISEMLTDVFTAILKRIKTEK